MRVLDLFAGAAGGWSLGLHRAGGFTTVAACEIDPWRRGVFSRNFPNATLYDDVRTLTAARLIADGCAPDVVVGSPPCQDISAANPRGAGVDGERSGLFFEGIRIIRELVACRHRPRWVCLENGPRLRNKGADRVLGELEALDYAARALVVGAHHIGAPHRRDRAWIIANAHEVAGQAGMRRAGVVERREEDGEESEGGPASDANQVRELQPRGMHGQFRGRPGNSSGEAAPHPDKTGLEIGKGLGRDDGAQQPTAERGADVHLQHQWFAGLVAHRRSNDGIPAGVARQCVEAYGDAVIPAIPRLIGRAILDVEQRKMTWNNGSNHERLY